MPEPSILLSIKKVLGLEPDYDVFDQDVILHINSVFSTLAQLGIGPKGGFMIEDDEAQWSTFLKDDMEYNAVKTYIYLRVRLLFDPPQTGYLVDAVKEQIKELEWRLNVHREDMEWVDPETGENPNLGVTVYEDPLKPGTLTLEIPSGAGDEVEDIYQNAIANELVFETED